MRENIKFAARASALHLVVSILVMIGMASVVFGLWFPYPYRSLASGNQMFWLVVGVDVVCGPLLTLVLFKPAKSRVELTVDMTMVVGIQLIALLYGLYSINLARPVVVIYEVDRFVAVSKAELELDSFKDAKDRLNIGWFSRPELLSVRPPKDGAETIESVELSLRGLEPSQRPSWWQPYTLGVPEVKQRMRKLSDLRSTSSVQDQAAIDAAVRSSQVTLQNVFYLPLTSRKMLDGWIMILNSEAQPVGYAEVGGFPK